MVERLTVIFFIILCLLLGMYLILSPWDAAALMPIIEEAGGVFTDWDGRRTAFGGSAIATNAALAQPLRALLSDHTTG